MNATQRLLRLIITQSNKANKSIFLPTVSAHISRMMMIDDEKMVPAIAVTMGDPTGIGPEIVAKLLADPASDARPAIVIGDTDALRLGAAAARVRLDVRRYHSIAQVLAAGRRAGEAAVLQTSTPLPADLAMGRIDRRAGAAAHAYVIAAADLALAGQVAAIVTAPINKEALAAAGISQPGHTEILADRAGVDHVAMMLANDELKVLLVSIHVSLADALRAVTFENECRAIRLAAVACHAFGIARPRVAVAGLNPHAGEEGALGEEDRTIVAPAVKQLRAEGIDAIGPLPADTLFHERARARYDVALCMYHDQALIPIKTLAFERAVNVTLGLPFVRTSPDHGTAFDIAGTGKADPSSLVAALALAARLTAHAPALVPAK
jgi:4-hydroxythreonine-4-phosphate dehydrogenase